MESLLPSGMLGLEEDLSLANLSFGLIGNGRTAALISAEGFLDWCCMPCFDAPAVFARILDAERGGTFGIVPLGGLNIEQQYVKNTNVLETRFTGHEASFSVLDFMPRYGLEYGASMHRPCQVLRLIEIHEGSPQVLLQYSPRFNYARGETQLTGLNENTLLAQQGEETLFLHSNLSLNSLNTQEPLTLTQGSFFAISYAEPLKTPSEWWILEEFKKTVSYWRHWVKHCYLPKDYQVEIIRSALTLKQLVCDETGAIIAAPSTSLPETIGGNRNWDYRYCWLRDSFFIVDTLLKLSQFEECEGLIGYLKTILLERWDYLRPVYRWNGETVPEEEILEHLSGYQGSRPVRIGNNATCHQQHDVYGEMMMAMYPLFTDERIVRTDREELWIIIQHLVKMALETFDQTDNGIWEFRNFKRHYTFSKMMCWAALDRGAKIARILQKTAEWRKWTHIKHQMRQQVLEKAWNPQVQAFTQSYGSPHLDASILLMPIIGMILPRDPRMVLTILQCEQRLMQNGLMFRYTNEDDFGRPENAFTICTFWLIDALALSGQKRKARRYFDHILKFSNHLGLFSEDINPWTGELTGNFPQGYTHVAIINSAMLLSDTPFHY